MSIFGQYGIDFYTPHKQSFVCGGGGGGGMGEEVYTSVHPFIHNTVFS